jgi:hypothetical protein
MPPISDRLEVVRQTSLPTEHCTTSFRSEDSLSRSIVTFIDLMIILGHFAPIGAAAFWFLVCLYHLTSIGHFPLRAVAELYAGIFSIHIAFRLAPQHDVYCRIIASLAHVIIGVPTVKEMLHFWTTSSQPSRDYGKTKESEFEKDRDVLRVSFFHKQIWLVSWTYVYVHGATHWKFQGSHNPSVLSILGTTSLALPIFFIIVALGQRYTLQTKGHIDYEAQREVRAEFPVPIEIFESMQAQGVDIGKSKMA